MPSFDPRCPYWLSLQQFADIQESERPAFQFRRISGREYLELEKVWDDADKRTSEAPDRLFNLVRIGLIDWRNQYNPETGEQVPFDPNRLNEVIDHVEAFEIIQRRLSSARLNGAELKNSESPA